MKSNRTSTLVPPHAIPDNKDFLLRKGDYKATIPTLPSKSSFLATVCARLLLFEGMSLKKMGNGLFSQNYVTFLCCVIPNFN